MTEQRGRRVVAAGLASLLVGVGVLSGCHKATPEEALQPEPGLSAVEATAEAASGSPDTGASPSGSSLSPGPGTGPGSANLSEADSAKLDSAGGVAGYRRVWSAPLDAGLMIKGLYVSDGGKLAGYRVDGMVRLFDRNGVALRLALPAGQQAVPLPDLQIWVTKPLEQEGKLRAWGSNGKLIWEAPAPKGMLQVRPDGKAILVSGQVQEGPHTTAFGPDGKVQWESDQFGGQVTFADGGDFLVWDREQKRLHVVSSSGAIRYSATRSEERLLSLVLSRDGRYLIDREGGVLEMPEDADERHAGPHLFQGPGPLFATNGRDLYIFLKEQGKYSKLEAFKPDGTQLWSIPAGAQRAEVSPDGKVVFFLDGAGVRVVNAESGAESGLLPGAREMALSADGRHLLVQFQDALTLFEQQ